MDQSSHASHATKSSTSPEGTLFTDNDTQVLIKLDENLLDICNDCEPQRKNLAPRSKPEQNDKLEGQLDGLQKQMKALAEKMKKSSDLINYVQNDLKSLKEKPPAFEPPWEMCNEKK